MIYQHAKEHKTDCNGLSIQKHIWYSIQYRILQIRVQYNINFKFCQKLKKMRKNGNSMPLYSVNRFVCHFYIAIIHPSRDWHFGDV